jgi:enoyl-CoA hydratase/carnithine racemase
MDYQALRCRKESGVMIARIIGPVSSREDLARLSDELTELCDELMIDEETQVVVLTDDGEDTFSTSTYYSFLEGIDEPEVRTRSLDESLARLDMPILAAIHGDAIGQGLELVLACDLRVASETSYFGLPHSKTGHIPRDGGTQRLARLVGRSKALEMILTGEMINAPEALRIGLVNKVVPVEQVTDVVKGMATEMASKGPVALRYAKEAVNKGMDMTLEQGLRLEADLYLLLHTTRDRTEGIKAFQEKRKPRFEGK